MRYFPDEWWLEMQVIGFHDEARKRAAVSDLEAALLFQLRAAGLPEPAEQYAWLPGRRFRADLAYPDRGLLIEVEGGQWVQGRHNRGSSYTAECRKHSLMALHGWRLIQVTGEMIRSGEALELIEQTVKGD